MAITNTREQLHRQIDQLPDNVVEQIADFTLSIMARRDMLPLYSDWNQTEWQNFSLEQFFQEGDEIEYSLEDAQEIYHS